MYAMDDINDIRKRFYEKGETISEIAKERKMDRKTVRKFIDMEDFNEPAPESKPGQRFCPKLDDFKPTIDRWLTDDTKAPRKQRHTAKRVFDRLKEKYPDTFDCSYRTVAAYYAVRRKEVILGEQNGLHAVGALPR